MPKFSIITPVHLWRPERVERFLQTMKSVEAQTFRDFEWVVVDDGSTEPFLWEQLLLLNEKIPHVTLLRKTHEERVIAYNQAFQVAQGDWFTLLDGDDEYEPEYLEVVNELIRKHTIHKMFNFGCSYHHKDGKVTFRDPFEPKKKKVGHEVFGGGNIVNGTFVFHRSVYEKLGGYPGDSEGYVRQVDTSDINYGGVRDLFMGTPYDFSAACQLEFPELQQMYMVTCNDEPNKVVRELGNPWGQDFLIFYKYTRKYHCKPIKEYLYKVYPR